MPPSDILGYCKTLKLAWVRDNLEELLTDAHLEDMELVEALGMILGGECEARVHNTRARYVKEAHFPYRIALDDYETAHLAPEVAREVKRLSTLEFMKTKSNVILIGNPGVGKTALAVALGMKVCAQGGRVVFLNVSDLIISVKEALSLNELTRLKKRFERVELVILDDLGYCSFNKECGEILFNLLSSRNENGSMIVTTNLAFDRWNEVFDDEILTGAIIDRLGLRAHVVDMSGVSYRVLETERWLKGGKETTA